MSDPSWLITASAGGSNPQTVVTLEISLPSLTVMNPSRWKCSGVVSWDGWGDGCFRVVVRDSGRSLWLEGGRGVGRTLTKLDERLGRGDRGVARTDL